MTKRRYRVILLLVLSYSGALYADINCNNCEATTQEPSKGNHIIQVEYMDQNIAGNIECNNGVAIVNYIEMNENNEQVRPGFPVLVRKPSCENMN